MTKPFDVINFNVLDTGYTTIRILKMLYKTTKKLTANVNPRIELVLLFNSQLSVHFEQVGQSFSGQNEMNKNV